MGKPSLVDQELRSLILDVVEAELLAHGSAELSVAMLVAERGQGALDREQRHTWEARVLPILSKPLSEQIAVASILRRGGYLPRKVAY